MHGNKKISSNEKNKVKKNRMKKIFQRSGAIKPKIWIGKEGITSTLIELVSRQLEIDKLVKIKIQRNLSKDSKIEKMALLIARDTNSNLVDVRGRTFTLYKDE